eukprot:gene6882-9428_t
MIQHISLCFYSTSLLKNSYIRLNVNPISTIPLQSMVSSSSSVEKKTFRRFMQIELWRNPELESLFPVLCSIEVATRDINRLMKRISTDNLDGLNLNTASKELPGFSSANITTTNTVNIQGEDQKKLDVIANRIMKNALCSTGKVSIIASEEDDKPCLCSDVIDNAAFSGEFAAAFDPLDGSSNIDSGLPTGTIFGIYRNPKFGPTDPMTTLTQKGSNLVVAGYCLYAASAQIVITMKTGVHIFSLDDVSGEFILTRSNVKIPRMGPIYSFNDANSDAWDKSIRYFINDFKKMEVQGISYEKEKSKKPSARYMGSLVADLHNIILNGGIFGYPGTSKAPHGKLRLLYEAIPMAVLIEECGGFASNGKNRILDLLVHDVHQRTPLFIGSLELVRAIERYIGFYSNEYKQ